MNYKFHIALSEEGYCKYNIFTTLKSPYAKPKILTFRILIALLGAFFAGICIYGKNTSGAVFVLAVAVIIELLVTPYMKFCIKTAAKSAKKDMKNAYSAEADLEFFGERVRETTADGIIERTYASLDRVCVVKDFGIVLYINPAIAFIVPDSSFKTQDEYAEFVNFIKTKVENTAEFA